METRELEEAWKQKPAVDSAAPIERRGEAVGSSDYPHPLRRGDGSNHQAIPAVRRSPASRGRQVKSESGHRRLDPVVQRIKAKVREYKKANLTFKEMCERLGNSERPPRATWTHLPWPKAYEKHTSAVSKWLSEAGSDQ